MADDQGKCSTTETGECSDSTIKINVKTLDSQIYTFDVNKDIPIPSLKAKVATASGVPLEQQRLIFRGKVLKDDHCLSDYHLEHGHTLHLVAIQPNQAQSQPRTVPGDPSNISDNQGRDPSSNTPHNRIGQVSHSVVHGIVRIGDGGEGMSPEIARVFESVLESMRPGILTPTTASNIPSTAAPTSGETEGSRNVSSRAQMGDQGQPAVTFGNQPFQVQLAPTAFVPPNMAIPDSLRTLLDFITRMELMLQSSGSQSSAPSNVQNRPSSDNAASSQYRLPTPDVLASVIEHARVLLSGNAATAFSHISERLRREASSSDLMVRSQIQSDAIHMGLVMQHLGAMLLELGRTTMTLQMGSSPDDSFVNAGPAVYISPTGPNPIMVQPSYSQMGSLFSASSPFVSGTSNPVGGDLLRNINIHILSGTSLAPGVSRANAGDANRSDPQNVEQTRQNGSGSGPSGNAAPTRGLAARTVVHALPARPHGEAATNVLNVVYPVHVRAQQLVPTYSASSQGSHSSTSSGLQPGTPVALLHSSPESSSVPPVVVQANVDGALSINPLGPVSSSFSLLPTAAQGSHSATSASQSNTTVHPPEVSSEMGTMSLGRKNEEVANLSSRSTTTQSTSGSLRRNADNVPGSADKSPESHVPEISTQGDKKLESLTTDVMGGPSRICSTEVDKSSEQKMKSTAYSHDSSSSKDSGTSTPLGLGLGGLKPKRRNKSMKTAVKDGISQDSPSANQSQESILKGQQFLRSLVSQGSDVNRDGTDASSTSFLPSPNQMVDDISSGAQGSKEQQDAGEMMSHLLQSSVFDGILANMAEQTGLGSPAGLKNMMEKCTRNPSVRSTLNNLVQQVQGQDLGSMISGSGRGEGGMDFSRMIQQMMPVVSQAFGRMSSLSPPVSVSRSEYQTQSNNVINNDKRQDSRFQIDLHEAQQRIEQCDSAGNIFRAMVHGTGSMYGEENGDKDLVEELGDDAELSNGYMEILRRDIGKRLDKESKSEEKP